MKRQAMGRMEHTVYLINLLIPIAKSP